MAENSNSNDFNAHQETYDQFVLLSKRAIVFLIFVVVALYFFVEAHIPLLGWALLVLSLPAPFFIVRSSRK